MTDAKTKPPPVSVCAIGASAGGVGALRELFRHLPNDLGVAYVVIIHLSPDQPSALDQILAAVTDIEVMQVTDHAILKPNCIYVIPPDRELVIDGDEVRARPFTEARGKRAPIDMFFRSVARGRGDGLSVILSGSGSDGAVGVRDMKESGGVIFVQEPTTAEFAMMPRSAIAMGVADFVAPIPRLVERMIEVARSKEAVRSLSVDSSDQALQRVVAFLRARTGHDFSSYKRATVMRRVARRMQVARCTGIGTYLEYLTTNPEEAQELFSDLLISVTSFFRDPAAYQALGQDVVSRIFEDADEEGIRIWVAGCATGEEAYSLAILLLEEADRRKISLPIQIFATDLDEGALATGREGRYPASIEADVSQERLTRFFVREGAHYRVKRELRDTVLFATHSVLKDPPFMRLNLISCRNLLIYLERQLQRQVCALFAYGLKPHGYLFLGSAETTDAQPDLFATISREARIYQARAQAGRRLPVISRFPTEYQPDIVKAQDRAARSDLPGRTVQAAHREALERGAPPSLLVDREFHVLNLSETAGRFLLPQAGPPSNDVTALVRPELRLDVRTAVRRAVDRRVSTLTPPIRVTMNGSRHRISLFVSPGAEGDDDDTSGEALVLFLDGGPVDDEAEPAGDSADLGEIRRLRDELHDAEVRSAASRAEHESAIQDLRVANEELQSINEEYRSASEELETSKEELQSMNEELQTVNAELKSKLEVIGAAHSDLQNLISATEIGTLFLDAQLRIRMFTPQVAEIFNVTEADIGRAVTDFTHRLVYDGLRDDALRVLERLFPVEREIETGDGRWLMIRLRPYRTVDDRIDGIVVTFVDITERRLAQSELRLSEARHRALFDAVDEGVCLFERLPPRPDGLRDYRYVAMNPAMCAMFDIPDLSGRTIRDNFPDEDEAWYEIYNRVLDTGTPTRFERESEPQGKILEMFVTRIGDASSRLLLAVMQDITERRRHEQALQASEERFRALTSASSEVLFRMGPDWREMRSLVGRGFLADTHEATTDWPGDYLLPEDQAAVRARIDRAIRDRAPLEMEHRVLRADGSAGWAFTRAVPIFDAQDKIVEWFGAATDVTERRRNVERLRDSEARLRTLAEGMPQLVWRATGEGEWTWCSPQWTDATGLSQPQSLGRGWIEAVHPDDRGALKQAWDRAGESGSLIVDCRLHSTEDWHRWFSMRASPIHDETGAIREWLGTFTDIDELRRLQDAQKVMVAELQHRTRNLINVVDSIAAQTIAQTGQNDAFRTLFGERLASLGRVQGLLSRAEQERITLTRLIELELDALGARPDGKRIVVAGPEVPLRNAVVQTLALAMHELTTNARKHGALSGGPGSLRVTWDLREDDDGQRVLIDWLETGLDRAPEAEDDGSNGYGRELIERALPYALDARTTFDLGASRLHCTIDLPLTDRVEQ